MHYPARTLTGIALVLLLGIPILLRVLGRPARYGRAWPAAAALLAVLAMPMAVHGIEYRGWLERVQLSLEGRSGIVDLIGSPAEYEAPTCAWPVDESIPEPAAEGRRIDRGAHLARRRAAADQEVPPPLPPEFHR